MSRMISNDQRSPSISIDAFSGAERRLAFFVLFSTITCIMQAIATIFSREGTPAASQVPAEWRSKILHARLVVGDSVLMASDAPPGHYRKPQGFSVSIQIKDTARGAEI